jgi:hypothetical protein
MYVGTYLSFASSLAGSSRFLARLLLLTNSGSGREGQRNVERSLRAAAKGEKMAKGEYRFDAGT